MSGILQITLGVVTAFGGFVDIGELVFSIQAGAKYGYLLLWAVVVGTIGIIIFSEMSGRIAAVIKKPVFPLIKEEFGNKGSFIVLVASTLLNVLTCAAEMGGVAIILQLLTGIDQQTAIILTVFSFIIIVWLTPFEILEKAFGILGLFMVIFLVTNMKTGLPTDEIVHGLIPSVPTGNSIVSYLYFAVGIISSSMMPYEVYFYSSGGIEEKWDSSKLMDNLLTSVVGMFLGAILSASLIMLGTKFFGIHSITPQLHGTSALAVSTEFGRWGLVIALLGIMFSVGGATVETCLAGAYNISQYFGWKWGRHLDSVKTPAFSFTWIAIFVFGLFVLMLGIDPVQLVEYAVIFSVVALPFTYYPIMKVADDKKKMGKHANNIFVKALGWIYFVIVCILAVVSVPLMILSHSGKV